MIQEERLWEGEVPPNTWVVIPTFNERENLTELLRRVFAQGKLQILIVDDNSPDGTGELAESLRATHPDLYVLHRPGKQGLGVAYRQGFTEVLARGAQYIAQCDADLSHAPEYLPELLRKLQHADLSIASRYVTNGKAEANLLRRWISIIGNVYIRLLLDWRIHDWSTGYKAWRAETLRQALAASTQTVGYAFLMEMTWHARQQGARITELPFSFVGRAHGTSKFTLGILVEDIKVAWRLKQQSRLIPPRSKVSK